MTKALVIIDVQKAIVDGQGSPARQPVIDRALTETAQRLQLLQDRARAAGVPVLIVQHDDQEDHRLSKGSPGWELRAEIAPRPGEPVIAKTACDSFYETDLKAQLDQRGVTHLVIGGCMSQYCVDTTARRAVTLGYDVTLVADGHTTADSGALGFEQIIAHHNHLLDGFGAGDRAISVVKAADVAF